MKVIFLDVDGVLNAGQRVKKGTTGFILKDWVLPHPIAHLNRITRETGAKLVISSTWRQDKTVEELREMFAGVGVEGEIIDKTEVGPCIWHHWAGYPECWEGHRGAEIAEWLRRKGQDVESYVIIDDDSDMGNLAHRHVKTKYFMGMVRADRYKVVELLQTESKK